MNSICVVIVTYNRLSMLKDCVHSAVNQSKKADEIIVVNNSSTDGTLEWLSDQRNLTVITQENSGSAGGFHTGINTAHEKGYEWIWCMDDDVVLYSNCFDELEKFNKEHYVKYKVIQPLKDAPLVNSKHHGAIYFDVDKMKVIDIYNDALKNKYLKTNSFCFEGVMINSSLIPLVGLPRRDYFITNDDREYAMRINKYFSADSIMLLGKVLMKRNITDNINNQSILTKIKNVSDWDIKLFQYYFRNIFISVRLHYPNKLSIMKALLFGFRHWRWCLKIILSILLFKKTKMQRFKEIYECIVLQGFKLKYQ